MKKILWLFSLIFLLFTSSAFSAVLYKTESLNHRIDVYGDYTSKGKTFAQLISSINASTLQSFDLIINSTVNITADVTIPSKVKNIYFNNNGSFYSASTTYNITFTNNTYINTNKQAFAGKINTLGVFANSKIYPWYWQATKNDATDDETGFTQFLNMVSGNSQITGVIDGTYYLISNVVGIRTSSNIVGEGSNGKIYTNGIPISGSTINISNIEFVKYSSGTSIFSCFTTPRYNINISGCTFRNGNQTLYLGQNNHHYNWNINNNLFIDCTYGVYMETARDINIYNNKFLNCGRSIYSEHTYNMNIYNNEIDGGIACIVSLPDVNRTNVIGGFNNRIYNNKIKNFKEEGISFDLKGDMPGTPIKDMDTILATVNNGVSLANPTWNNAPTNKWQNYYVIGTSGKNKGKFFKILSSAVGTFNLEILSSDLNNFQIGDNISIGIPFWNNVIENNSIVGSPNGKSETGIFLYGLCYNNTVKNNTLSNLSARGIGIANLFGITDAGSFTKDYANDLNALNEYNTIEGNVLSSCNIELTNTTFGGATSVGNLTTTNRVLNNMMINGATYQFDEGFMNPTIYNEIYPERIVTSNFTGSVTAVSFQGDGTELVLSQNVVTDNYNYTITGNVSIKAKSGLGGATLSVGGDYGDADVYKVDSDGNRVFHYSNSGYGQNFVVDNGNFNATDTILNVSSNGTVRIGGGEANENISKLQVNGGVSINGTVSANFVIGNGAGLTEITATYVPSNVVTDNFYPGQDKTVTISNMVIGYGSGEVSTDRMNIRHENQTSNNYAIMQDSNGYTYINAKSGTSIFYRKSNSTVGLINDSNQWIIGGTSAVHSSAKAQIVGDAFISGIVTASRIEVTNLSVTNNTTLNTLIVSNTATISVISSPSLNFTQGFGSVLTINEIYSGGRITGNIIKGGAAAFATLGLGGTLGASNIFYFDSSSITGVGNAAQFRLGSGGYGLNVVMNAGTNTIANGVMFVSINNTIAIGGICPTNNTAKLFVNGGIRSEALTVNGTVVLPGLGSGAATAVGVDGNGNLIQITSSKRFKENITDLKVDSSKIYDLRPVEFDYKNNGGHAIGYIAEEMDKIIPEVVRYDNNKKPYSISYEQLIPLLIKELKACKEKINYLENQVLK